jgi:hypothetical protein
MARSASKEGRAGAASAGGPGPAGAGGGRRADVVRLAGELFAQKQKGFRADLDPRLTYRLLRDVLRIPSQWRVAGGYSTDQVAEGLLQLLFRGITAQ